MKVLEHILTTIILEQVSTDDISFGLMPGRGTIDVIFILRQLQKKYLHKQKNTSFAFVDLKKAFLIVHHVLLFGGECKNLEYMNGRFRFLYPLHFC